MLKVINDMFSLSTDDGVLCTNGFMTITCLVFLNKIGFNKHLGFNTSNVCVHTDVGTTDSIAPLNHFAFSLRI